MTLIPVPGQSTTGRALLDEPSASLAAWLDRSIFGAGLMWDWVFPINKNLWTSSYVLVTAGMAGAALAGCIWLADVLAFRPWTKPFVVFGVNPLLAFIGSGAMARLIYSVIQVSYHGEKVPVQRVTYVTLFASWLAPRNASLLFAVTFVLLWAAL